MKKTNRLIIFALSLAIVISALVGISVNAAEATQEEGALEIKTINVAYSDKLELLVVVDIPYAEWESVELTYTFDGESYVAKHHPTETYTEDEVEYPVFYTIGVAPKDIGKSMTFEAHIKDSGVTGAPYSASILDYLYARLYKKDFINAEEGEDLAKKNLYLNAIDYASSALEVLVNYKQGKNETLYNEYAFIWGTDSISKVAGDRLFGAFVPGTEITPHYAGEFEIKHWNVYDASGAVVDTMEAGESLILNEHTKLEVVQKGGADPDAADYEDGKPYGDYVKTYSTYDPENSNNNVLVENTSWATGGSTSSTAGLDVDPTDAANHVLHVRTAASKTTFTTKVTASNALQEGSCYTFETRVYAAGFGGDNYIFANLKFVNEKGTSALDLNLKSINNSSSKPSLAIVTEGDSSNLADNTTIFDYNKKSIGVTTWCTIRVEFYFAGGNDVSGDEAIDAARNGSYLKVYVDDVLAYDDVAHWVVTSDISHVELVHMVANKPQNMLYDDISFTRTNKDYVAGNEYAAN